MRWVIGGAAFLAPVVIVMSTLAKAPGAEPVQAGAAFLVETIAETIDAPRDIGGGLP